MLEQIEVPGEFYQLDIEMAFIEQEDIFNLLEDVLTKTFSRFSKNYCRSTFFLEFHILTL